MRIAVTADLHWGIRSEGDIATMQLVASLVERPVDLLILAGDIGAGDEFERCLELFAPLPGRKALVPGNHDIWVTSADARGDSWNVYSEVLPECSARHGFHYLDRGPLIIPGSRLGVIGSINWYDYSWAEEPRFEFPDDWNDRLREMRFTRGRHNDRRYVRWTHSDASFTAQCVAQMERQIEEALVHCEQVIAVTHHPAFRGLNPPENGSMNLDRMLWRAFSGNSSMEQLLKRFADRIDWVFSGHTHRMRENTFGPIRGQNIGGDYDWKRLLRLDWPANTIEAEEFPPT